MRMVSTVINMLKKKENILKMNAIDKESEAYLEGEINMLKWVLSSSGKKNM